MAIAGNEYYDNLDKALRLLASADSQRSTTNSTAGEAMRFYNQFRDSRLSEQPTLVDTGALIEDTKRNNWSLNDLIDDDWYGGMNMPLRVANDDQQYMERVRFPDGRNSQISSTTKDGWFTPDQSYIGIGRFPDQNDQSVSQGTSWSAPEYFMTIPSGLSEGSVTDEDGQRTNYTRSNYNTTVELKPEQFDQLQMSMRASLPLPAQLQLLANFYGSDNFRLNNTIENILGVYPEMGERKNIGDVIFRDPSNVDRFGSNADVFSKAAGVLMNDTTGSQAYARIPYQGLEGAVVFPMGTASVEDDNNFSLLNLFDFGSGNFQDIAAHELGHALVNEHSISNDYWDAMYADAETPPPTNLDYSYMSNTPKLFGLNGLGQANYPYNSSYGKTGGHEAIAEDLAMWALDKMYGYTAQGQNIFKMNTGDKYTYADLYPNRAALFDYLFGYDVGTIEE